MPQLLAAKLRALRIHYALTQVEVARRLGLRTHTRVGQLEGPTASERAAPSLALLVQFATVFAVPTDYLLRDTIPVLPLPSHSHSSAALLPLQPSLGLRLRALRTQRALSQATVTTHLGLAQRAYVSNLEAGRKTPSLDLLVRIADLFGVSTDEVLGRMKAEG